MCMTDAFENILDTLEKNPFLFPVENDHAILSGYRKAVFVKRKCEQKGPKKVSTFSTRFHVVSNAFPKYQMLTF